MMPGARQPSVAISIAREFQPQQYVGSGDQVVAIGSWDIRAKDTGRSAHSDWAIDFSLRNGKVTRWQAYMDTAALQAAHAGSSKAAT
jgi:ketosteroid isomerase-like protein